ncbi:hypothetical protein [Shimia abyssi]|uniref:Uncharacterized protein n=1 Tax=Shimia abyssi TaxID=1662395 RepID=A0A2P8EVI6_9RHOB|nr:hypothetical protein [Shimia abyssi]PSL13476.1 hypothetical protein CLV88_1332 [Shimia abyssi]
MPPPTAIVVPNEEELNEIAEVGLQIPNEHIQFFVQSVQGVARTLSAFQKRGIHPNEAIKRTKTALSDTIANLRKAQSAFSSEEDLIRYFSDEDLSSDLAALFSIPGIEMLTGRNTGFSIDERDLELAIKRSRDGGAKRGLAEIQRTARYAMAENPAQPITNLLGLLIKHLEDQIELIGPLKRGKPRDEERQYALTQLSHTFERVFDAKPTSTPEGRFCSMCEQVFESIGMSTTGLDTAITRHLVK